MLEFVNDSTVEGATILMNKVGKYIDRELKSIEENMKSTEQKELRKSNPDTAEIIKYIFTRFLQISNDNDNSLISYRNKLLIKNMLDDRTNGWFKTTKQKH